MLLFIFSLLLCACAAHPSHHTHPTPGAGDDALATVRDRLFAFFMDNGDCTQNDPAFCADGGCLVACDPTRDYSNSLDLSNFTWPDINYTDQTRSFWQTSAHLTRVIAMVRSFQCPECAPFRGNTTLLTQIKGALDFWLAKDFINPNWWHNCFGVPQMIEVIAILLEPSRITPAEHTKMLQILERANGSYTGENFVWSQEVLIGRAVVAEDAVALNRSFSALWQALFFSPPQTDGVQVDGSFFQHGPMLQSGSYGADFAMDLIIYTHVAANTSVQIPADKLDILARLVLDGQQFMQRWNKNATLAVTFWDVSVKGREISRPPTGQLAVNSLPLIPALRTLGGPRAAEFSALADRFIGNGTTLTGSRHYWCADYLAHHTEAFFISLHLKSNRTLPSECVNSENLKGWHLADGATMLYQDGAEYQGIFPVWSWTRIPGTTARQGVQESICDVGIRGSTAFVGGVCYLGMCVSAMDFVAANWGGAEEGQAKLTAQKSWFMTPAGMVALGDNVTLALNASVTTTLDQSILRGDVYGGVLGGKPSKLVPGQYTIMPNAADYIWHSNMLYVLRLSGLTDKVQEDTFGREDNRNSMDRNQINNHHHHHREHIHAEKSAFGADRKALRNSNKMLLSNTAANGTWSSINDACSSDVVVRDTFVLEASHGFGPRGSTYSYAVLPGVALAQVDAAITQLDKTTTVTGRESGVHSVRYLADDGLDVLMVAAFAKGVAVGAGWNMAVDADSLWIMALNSSSATMTITAASPLPLSAVHATTTTGLTLSGGEGGITCTPLPNKQTLVTVTLPKAPTLIGSPVSGSCRVG